MRTLYRAPENQALVPLLEAAQCAPDLATRIDATARALVRHARASYRPGADITGFLQQYSLGEPEGIALLCLAEALLRIPDSATADALIDDRIGSGDWQKRLGQSGSLLVNASSWGLALTGRVLTLDEAARVPAALARVMRRMGEPVIRTALRQGMRMLAKQFVLGRSITEALDRANSKEGKIWRYSFDMLGEAARTMHDANRYMTAYMDAVGAVGRVGGGPVNGPGVSVKLSALHPRYEESQRAVCVPDLIERLTALSLLAKDADIGLTMDAEEADRLEISLDVFEAVMADPRLKGWDGLGLAIQAYQKRCPAVVDWVAALARHTGHRIPARLVKGAYWDSEIKYAQIQGMEDYPVFTRKSAADVSWLACARKMLSQRDAIRCAFATHNAHSLASILELAPDGDFEMQRLHGMGEPLYESVVGTRCAVRVYAPVGTHEDLLAYLVRRLLENGANTSFVHGLVDPAVPEDSVIADPVAKLRALGAGRNPRIPLPADLFPDRRNSAGLDLSDRATLPAILAKISETRATDVPGGGDSREIRAPSDNRIVVGRAADSSDADVEVALNTLRTGWHDWDAMGGDARATILERAADLIEADRETILYLLAREAGRTLADGIAEIREAADFCRWYALHARRDFSMVRALPGPTGESNQWSLGGRGVFLCISPWNFPLAIFTGQIAAALAAGNAVAAKPAEQTPLIAAHAVGLLHKAGVPKTALQLLLGDGADIGAKLVRDPRIDGVAFTGGTDTARSIAQELAARPGPIVPFIAETGGINAMIVDSSALTEQVVVDAITSAFGSAGQRCSALRLLCLQADIAPRVLEMLHGAAKELRIGDPADPATDIGPVIDAAARAALEQSCAARGAPLWKLPLPPGTETGSFFAPRLYELLHAKDLRQEIFGPVLHVLRYTPDQLDDVLRQINELGFGLTLGIHSRIEGFHQRVARQIRAGNVYINRNQIGAVVGVQPFGGRGLSGTGPKAGGPITLFRFAEERVVTVNTTAAGGNAALLATDEG